MTGLWLALLVSTLKGPVPVPPPEVAVAEGLNRIHRENWPQLPGQPEPTRLISDHLEDRARYSRLVAVKNGILCAWIGGLDMIARAMQFALAYSDKLSGEQVQRLMTELADHQISLAKNWDQHCRDGGPNGPLNPGGHAAEDEWATVTVDWKKVLGPNPGSVVIHRGASPFPLPPLPTRAGQDFGGPLVLMLERLELALAAGGHTLRGEARACAWAVSGTSTVKAFRLAQASTPGIDQAGATFAAREAQHCVGAAKAQQEAAWAWLREHPKATQPLVVPLRRPVGVWPAPGGNDPVLWFGAALSFFAPELLPVAVFRAATR